MTNKQNTVYNGSRQRTESEEQLSEREGRQSADKQIVCTTEVVIEDARRTSPV